MAENIIIGSFETPAGSYSAAITPRGLARLDFPGAGADACWRWAQRWEPRLPVVNAGPALDRLAEQLRAYFAGQLQSFDLPLDLRGTDFQLAAWRGLLEIEYGTVRTYAQHAAAIGHPRAIRAVGAANGANPIPIVVPCHRLIGSDGSLIKYGGGLNIKRDLLAIEHAPLTFGLSVATICRATY